MGSADAGGKLVVSAKSVIDTLRRAKGLGTRLKQVQDKLAMLQKESQRAIDDEDDVYSDDLKNHMSSIQNKIALARSQHGAILENIHNYQAKHQQLGTINAQLRTSPDLKHAAISLRTQTDELLRYVVQQTLNLENIVFGIEETLNQLSPTTEDWVHESLLSWKENVPLLYDTLITYNLDYQAYACAWGGRISESSWKNSRFSFQKLYISRSPAEKQIETGVHCTLDILHTKLPSLRVYDEKKLFSSLDPRRKTNIPYKSRIIHPGPVNRMMSFPMLPDIVVSIPIAGSSVYVWNTKTQPDRAIRQDSAPNDADVLLVGLSDTTSYGLDVHSTMPLITAASNEGNICVWSLDDDVHQHPDHPSSRGLMPRYSVTAAHSGPVEDLAFHPSSPTQFCSGGGDGKLKLWDCRQPGNAPAPSVLQTDEKTITGISWNRHSDHLILSACANGTVQLFDLRRTDEPVSVSLLHPGAPVSNVQWCPNHFNVFASTAVNRQMYICDAQLMSPKRRDYSTNELPPEVLFSHEGQLGEIAYFEWNIQEPLMLVSICERDEANNMNATVQIWRPSDFLFMDRQRFVSMVKDLGR
eukprot:TRINITY_DN74639_c0_g1_i1.p1 TRINITY_DN74639_c0_g1~~TRINITY_DN74639_c0_g1_i1.p1  ORF type:complete len:610 (-),score=119.97 TRINITY_DN74639_c0_g1_i1:38-1786(-)